MTQGKVYGFDYLIFRNLLLKWFKGKCLQTKECVKLKRIARNALKNESSKTNKTNLQKIVTDVSLQLLSLSWETEISIQGLNNQVSHDVLKSVKKKYHIFGKKFFVFLFSSDPWIYLAAQFGLVVGFQKMSKLLFKRNGVQNALKVDIVPL